MWDKFPSIMTVKIQGVHLTMKDLRIIAHHTLMWKILLYFPFGYGLSYTQFIYSSPSISSSTLTKGKSITASVEVSNTGYFDGEEVVQLYIRDRKASVSRPVKELKGFQKITLKAGESVKVDFEITEEMISLYDINNNCGS